MKRVAVTELEYDKARVVFEAAEVEGFQCCAVPEEETELAAALNRQGVNHAIVGVAPYCGPLYEALPRGGVLARFGVGHDGIDKALATRCGLICTNTPGVLDDSVAEHAITLMLAAARHLPVVAQALRAGSWSPELGGELRSKVLAVIGCGAIGSRVARIAAFGFGMRVVGCDVQSIDPDQMKVKFGFERIVADFGEAVGDADFVSIHIPSTPATAHFVNAVRLAQLPTRAWLVNTARGAIVDEVALYDALQSGSLAGAALDVFEAEPYEPIHAGYDLRSLANVVLTPHVGSSTREACDRIAIRTLQNILAAEGGEHDRLDLLNPEVLDKLKNG